jgi:hypothetical protein
MAAGGDAGDNATWFTVRMDRRDEIRDPLHRLYGLEEEKTPRSLNSRGAVRPPWPRIAAVLPTVAWNHPQLELLEIPLAPRSLMQHPRPSSSPLAATVVRRRRMGEAPPTGRSASDKLLSQIRAPRAAPPTPLGTKAGQRRQHALSALTIADPSTHIHHPSPPRPVRGEAAADKNHTCRKTKTTILLEGVVDLFTTSSSGHRSSKRARRNPRLQISPP